MNVQVLTRKKPSGWGLNMVLVPCADGRTIVYSPTWLGDSTFAQVEAIGRPALLVAPNHFHNLSLARFHAQYPDVPVVAGDGAIPRLKKKTQLDIASVHSVASQFPDITFLECAGTKSGETWCLTRDGSLVVCDSFFHVQGAVSGFEGMMLKWLKTAPGLCLGTTFNLLVVKDSRAYREWVETTLAAHSVRRVYFSHGEKLEADNVREQLLEVLHKRLKK